MFTSFQIKCPFFFSSPIKLIMDLQDKFILPGDLGQHHFRIICKDVKLSALPIVTPMGICYTPVTRFWTCFLKKKKNSLESLKFYCCFSKTVSNFSWIQILICPKKKKVLVWDGGGLIQLYGL